MAKQLEAAGVTQVRVRSVLRCKTRKGLCGRCYGYDLGFNKPVNLGVAVGIIAAQSIGEPGTQLTMRTFHTGGVAGLDITQCLPRVEEIFEARPPKVKAFLAESSGKIIVEAPERTGGQRFTKIKIVTDELSQDAYPTGKNKKKIDIQTKDGAKIKKGDTVMLDENGEKVVAKRAGTVKIEDDQVLVVSQENKMEAYQIPSEYSLVVKDGDLITKGDPLTDGSLDLN